MVLKMSIWKSLLIFFTDEKEFLGKIYLLQFQTIDQVLVIISKGVAVNFHH